MAVVGTAYVVYRGLTNQLEKDLAKGVKNSGESAAVEQQAAKAGDQIGEKVGKSTSKPIEKGIVNGVRGANDSPGLRREMDRVGDQFGESLERSAKRNKNSFAGIFSGIFSGGRGGLGGGDNGKGILDSILPDPSSIARAGQQMAETGAELGQEAGKAASKGLMGSMSGGWQSMALKAAAIIGAVVALGPALSGVVVAAAGVAGVAMLGLAGIAGGLGLAFLGGGEHVKLFKSALSEVAEEAKTVGREISGIIFPPMIESVRALSATWLPALKDSFIDLAPAMHQALEGITKTLTSPALVEAVQRVIGTGGRMVGKLGQAAASAGAAFVYILDAARPLAEAFGDWVKTNAAVFLQRIQEAARDGSLAAFFQKAGEMARGFWSMVTGLWEAIKPLLDPRNGQANVFIAIGDAFRILAPFVQLLVQGFSLLSWEFRNFGSLLLGMIPGLGTFLQILGPVSTAVGWLAEKLGGASAKANETNGPVGTLTTSLWENQTAVLAADSAWKGFNSTLDAAEDADLAIERAVKALDAATKDQNTTINEQKSAVRDAVAEVFKGVDAWSKNGESAQVAQGKYDKLREQIITMADEILPGARDAAEEYVDELGLIPKNVTTLATFKVSAGKKPSWLPANSPWPPKSFDAGAVMYDPNKDVDVPVSVNPLRMPGLGGPSAPATGAGVRALTATLPIVPQKPAGYGVAGRTEGAAAVEVKRMMRALEKLASTVPVTNVFIGEQELNNIVRIEAIRRENEMAEVIRSNKYIVGLA